MIGEKMLIHDKEKTSSFFCWGFEILNKWLQIKNSGGSLTAYFDDNVIRKVAIYGLGTIGKRLFEELAQGETKVLYGIDRNASSIQIEGLKIKTLKENLPMVDAVVVTPISFYEIEKDIRCKMGKDIDVIFIEDVVQYCWSQL